MGLFSKAAATAVIALTVSNASASVVDPDALVEGESIGFWTGEWWQWVINQSPDDNAFTVPENPAVGQSGPVWFLAGTFGNEIGDPTVRKIHIPEDTYVLFPMVISLALAPFDGDTEEELRMALEEAQADVAPFASIDGVLVEIITGLLSDDFETESPFRTFDIPANNLFGLTPEDFGLNPGDDIPPTEGLANGWWVMLEPFGPNETKVLNYGGTLFNPDGSPSFTTEALVTVTTPVPAGVALLAVGLVGLGVAARRTSA